MSVFSIASSVLGGDIIGATPVKSDGILYGAINYGDKSGAGSTVGEQDGLPSPPPSNIAIPQNASSPFDEEDVVSYLAEAMRKSKDEDCLFLLITPREDDNEEVSQLISDVGTPNPTPLQIMDAIEVEGGYLLTPTGGNTHDNIFRSSTTEDDANLLPDSVEPSVEREDNGALLYPEDCVVARNADADDNASPKANVSPAQPTSSSNPHISIDSTESKTQEKETKLPKHELTPKTASMAKRSSGGLVKARASIIQQRIAMLEAASSYDSHDARHTTTGGVKVHPKVQTNFVRSVPIAISKTYSRDSSEGGSRSSIGSSYAQKYTACLPVRSVPIGISKTYSRDSSDGMRSLDRVGIPL
jgi:hypothetical protein